MSGKLTTEPKTLATIGGGCFWCLEAVFERIPGVHEVVSGYAGGTTENPTYREVCEGTTGHAEVCQVQFDPEAVSYEKILEVFWRAHDPTTLNRQGNDVGTQYRSIILTHNENQRATAEASRDQAAADWQQPIVTEIKHLEIFHPAEKHHQDYFRNHPGVPYCAFVIQPKLDHLAAEGTVPES
tara:strand:- start:497 stop:1045 length:549 start_codon:yes stop_codon:yes gene_type:complete